MDRFNDQLLHNGSQYKKALDRIIDKYSKLHYHDGGLEVEFNKTNIRTIQRYMNLSQVELHKLESKSLADLREESLRAQDNTRHSLLDLSCHDPEYGETPASTSQSFEEEDGTARNDATKVTVSSLQENWENQDNEVEMTLRNHSTLVELYPSMISRIERAWHRQNMSKAADGVLKKYHKWRQHSNRSNVSDTSVVSLQRSKQRRGPGRMLPLKNRPERERRAEYVPVSPVKTPHKLQGGEAQQQRPQTREHNWPVLVMDSAVKRVYSSPVRQSQRMLTSVGGSPPSLYSSHKEPRGESSSRETQRSPSLLTSPGSSLQRPPVNVRVLHSPQVSARQPARAEGRVRLQRHLSFDSSQASQSTYYSPEKVDEDFKKLYHKMICQKLVYNAPPCRLCAEHSATSHGQSFRALAALALSPHRSRLRKRQRETGWDGCPPSKCSKEEY